MANIPAPSGHSAAPLRPAVSPQKSAQEVPVPAPGKEKGNVDGFKGSPELSTDKDPGSKRDLSSLKAAFGSLTPSEGELTRAHSRGQNASEMKRDRDQDQRIVDHVCGEGCGCKPKLGDDPLKSLQARDEEVRKHEDDHLKEAGEFAAGGPTFKTHTASDGRAYVTSGEVNVDVGEVKGNPQKTVEKMNRVEKAALKPENPSEKDKQVARDAVNTRMKAESDLKYQ
ncbi:hypothetical protein IV102_22605 [bacterium]|nr:hypothetical protein [bacterium]